MHSVQSNVTVRKNRKVVLCLLVTLVPILIIATTACSRFRAEAPSILVIAVDQLQNANLGCHRDNAADLSSSSSAIPKSGFALLCQNSIRFTHAYTTSILAQPAMSSLLSGLYPFEHGVRDNGSNFLSARIHSVAHEAKIKGLATAFFSGGAPILRNSGLQQGFDLFDDNIPVTSKRIFRSADETLKLATTWIKSSSESFFSVVYLTDLLFPRQPTANELGEMRTLSLDSQLEELDTRLYELFSVMKKEKRWDSTTIILVGLSGRNSVERKNNIPNLNLHSEQTQIAMLIKPVSKPRDQGLSWTFDDNVSLADLGHTLFGLIGANEPTSDSELTAVDLRPALVAPGALQLPERWIVTESMWGPWRKVGPAAVALRKESNLIIHDKGNRQYATLSDSSELSPVEISDAAVDTNGVGKILNKVIPASVKMKQVPLDYISSLFCDPNLVKSSEAQKNLADVLEEYLKARRPLATATDAQTIAHLLIHQGRWAALGKLGYQSHSLDWIALAERNQGRNQTLFTNPCLKMIDEKRWAEALLKRGCQERDLLTLVDNFAATEKMTDIQDHNDANFRRVQKTWRDNLLFEKIQNTNAELGFPWNISEQKISDTRYWEMGLALPSLQKLKTQLAKEP